MRDWNVIIEPVALFYQYRIVSIGQMPDIAQ
jgi:hypothetical protein